MIEFLIACSPPLDGSSFTCPTTFPPIEKPKEKRNPPTSNKDRDFTTYEIKTEIWRYEFKDPT